MNNICSGCATVAWAIQYVIPVDDPHVVPENVRVLMRQIERELRYFASVSTLSEPDPAQAEARLRRFLEQDAELREHFFEMLERAPDNAPRPAARATSSTSPGSRAHGLALAQRSTSARVVTVTERDVRADGVAVAHRERQSSPSPTSP